MLINYAFFNEAEKHSDSKVEEPTVEEITYKRDKKSNNIGKKDNLANLERKIIEHKLEGDDLICDKCGSKSLYIYESNNKKIVKATCSERGKDILLFDESKHEWNGFVCKGDFLDRNKPFILTECDKCNNSKFNINITIESQGKEDFIEECGINDDINSEFKEVIEYYEKV